MTPTGVLLVTPIFLWGVGTMSLLVGLSCVALALHKARCGTPFGVTSAEHLGLQDQNFSLCFLRGLLNLRGWCWARIKQLALIGSSSSLHSEACKALGGSDGVVHSTISLAAICMRAVAKQSTRFLPAMLVRAGTLGTTQNAGSPFPSWGELRPSVTQVGAGW